jgi:predicted AlkP superfamily pyrophosphatase or phosphodiesterase
MSGYSIDFPPDSPEISDDEQDIVVSGASVTDQDRDLLRADDEVVKALGQKANRSKLSNLAASFMPKRKIKFASDYQPLGDQRPNKIPQGAQRLDTFSSNSHDLSEESSDEFGDIEIDLETQPIRRRPRNRPLISGTHYLLLVVLLLGALLLLSWNSDRSNESSSRKPISKRLVSNGTHDFYPTTLVVSLDGFHPHYVSEELSPNLHSMFIHNSGVPYMTPVFPSSTFPNHWTLVTGLYPANHGIVGNSFYDPKLGRRFFNTKPSQSLSPEWWGGEPLWQTAAFQGVSTAVHMWPGSEVPWAEGAPIVVDAYNGSEVLSAKRDRVFEWIDRDLKTRPELILTYVPTVDTLGHQHGIAGPEIRDAIRQVDDLIGEVLQGISERNLGSIVNLIVVSDHGMAPTSNDRIVFLDDIMDTTKIDHIDGWPLVGLRLKESVDDNQVYQELKRQEPQDHQNWQVYLKDNLPKEWNFGGMQSQYESRIAPLWLVPQVGWSITTHAQLEEMGGVYKPFGVHGYNNTETLMRALFLAIGPYFSDNKMYQPIPNIDIYNIVCDTLNLVPAKTDGAPPRRALQPLPSNWKDPQQYPNVDFYTEILQVNSTYDALFGADSNPLAPLRVANNSTTTDSETADGVVSTVSSWLHGIGSAASDALSSVTDWVSSKLGGS